MAEDRANLDGLEEEDVLENSADDMIEHDPEFDDAHEAEFDQVAAALVQVGEHTGRIAAQAREDVADALARRGAEQGDMLQPDWAIVAPAMAMMSYSPLRQQVANLMASSIDRRFAEHVHPSFVEILKQLTEDEIALLDNMPDLGMVVPMIDVIYLVERGRCLFARRNVLPASLAVVCQKPQSAPQYIDNLVRLSLLEIPTDRSIDHRSYRSVIKQPLVQDLEEAKPDKAKVQFDRKLICITDFGEQFRRVCLT